MHPTTPIAEAVKGDKHEVFTKAKPHCLHRVEFNALASRNAMAAELARESDRLEHVSARCDEVNTPRRVLENKRNMFRKEIFHPKRQKHPQLFVVLLYSRHN